MPVQAFKEQLAEEYERRFPRSAAHHRAHAASLLDGCSHAVRWAEPFMPVASRASGARVVDLDGHEFVDYWQGHFTNLLGHNPPLIRDALARALDEGRGLQTGMLHELEARAAELIVECTGTESVRVTTSGSLGTFYASLLCRGFTGRDLVLKVRGGWHGSQPFGLKGVSPHGEAYDRIETEGLSSSTPGEILLTRYNDIDELQRVFRDRGDRIACMLVEPVMGQGGGIAATPEYMREVRRLTAHHGALLVCDEIITGFRFRAGDLTQLYGIEPDLLVLGKVLGGGMPVAAVAGRRDLLALCTREQHRVKFEGGTYSAHELGLLATVTLLEHLIREEPTLYPALARAGGELREEIRGLAERAGVAVSLLGTPEPVGSSSSLLMLHVLREPGDDPASPEEMARRAHPVLDDDLLKSVFLLHGVSVRTGLGAISTVHDEDDFHRTLEGLEAGFDRLRRAGLVDAVA
ncbi:MAG: aminotransferase class III-fold pyridoxal phosphate-dependent enzyme [Acidobacteria bacterium]|nr:aminotransferase class III-fold pyridoxal phosphate-dependent enzyme [Acidobacteriota bacterium]NIM61898.1 aminotransferase class III-fold pyridoxal phosphate-dependent enzyme [Acidobacteriota bacterium]NIO60392.1 aminotransferase class III-fold pyridoxal phosphate-dependent enzyme [Acidobacteriota bacterium]NIQ31464.1 aminotransferase class III-fold pyridoxal phosphate-dependent enzyme [Acidobacteriota bacterium]NIQ86708.1 aminotransferase class III-fold pyridoxal phosphate-dependent enzyme